jgi:hypothetical protein
MFQSHNLLSIISLFSDGGGGEGFEHKIISRKNGK